MHILYDGQIYLMQVAGGINRYFANLINRLSENDFPAVTICETRNVNFPSHPNLKTFYFQRRGFRPRRVSFWLEKIYFRAISKYKKFDLVHPTYYSLLTGNSLDSYRIPTVITVHDMIHEKFYPDAIDVEDKRKAIMAADAIICVSQNTKTDLLERYSLPEEKITVTYLASELDASMSYGAETVPTHPYFLYIGNRMSYKNFDGLLLAFAKVAENNRDVKLCVVGSPFNPDEQQLISELKLDARIEFYGYVSDQHLAKLYRCSVAFVYPSLYEGFGIPPLEAINCGTVVVAANTSSIPEVVGNGGLLFNPDINHELSDMLLFLLDNPSERERIIARGYKQAQNFSWDKTAAQTFEVYRNVTKVK
ncbi:MAG: glycosyltransferase family 4 protein [Calothrix sp. C42_A2020_038]|nr:glycosyltransferase family 4 protein [Calothrix sp. C42_A2020_038]